MIYSMLMAVVIRTPIVLASLLDVRIKGNGIPTDHMPKAWEFLLHELIKCVDRKKYQCSSSDLLTPLTQESVNDEEVFDPFSFQSTEDASANLTRSDGEIDLLIQSDMESEIARYKTRTLHKTLDPLQWWKSNAGDFPNLAKAARKYLCVPASSASVERLFSHAGDTIAADRARLDPYYASELVFLRVAWEKIEDFEKKGVKY